MKKSTPTNASAKTSRVPNTWKRLPALTAALLSLGGALVLAPSVARAQFSNNFQTNIITSANSTNWLPGNYFVGSNTASNVLILNNNGS
jgi:hypothetical protein